MRPVGKRPRIQLIARDDSGTVLLASGADRDHSAIYAEYKMSFPCEAVFVVELALT